MTAALDPICDEFARKQGRSAHAAGADQQWVAQVGVVGKDHWQPAFQDWHCQAVRQRMRNQRIQFEGAHHFTEA